jgi:hypothetical protein
MPARSQRPPRDRQARSKAVQLLAQSQPLLRGSLVEMARTCGKKGCRCQQGHKHVSLYLSTRLEGKRTMIYIPEALAERVRNAVEATRRLEGWIEEAAQEELQLLLRDKTRDGPDKSRETPRRR